MWSWTTNYEGDDEKAIRGVKKREIKAVRHI